MTKQIYLYAEEGADYAVSYFRLKKSLPDYTIKCVKRADIINPAFSVKHVTAFFMPGAGPNGEADKRLGLDGMAAIRDYVRKGGLFFGTCAGAYYASSRLEWQNDIPTQQRIKTSLLDLFNGTTAGPIRTIMMRGTDKTYNPYKAVATPVIFYDDKREVQLKALYQGGPIYCQNTIDNDPTIEILARFTALENYPPCILKKNVGMGHIVLSSIHAEVSTENLVQFTSGTHNQVDAMKALERELAPYGAKRNMIWQRYIRDIEQQHLKQRELYLNGQKNSPNTLGF